MTEGRCCTDASIYIACSFGYCSGSCMDHQRHVISNMQIYLNQSMHFYNDHSLSLWFLLLMVPHKNFVECILFAGIWRQLTGLMIWWCQFMLQLVISFVYVILYAIATKSGLCYVYCLIFWCILSLTYLTYEIYATSWLSQWWWNQELFPGGSWAVYKGKPLLASTGWNLNMQHVAVQHGCWFVQVFILC